MKKNQTSFFCTWIFYEGSGDYIKHFTGKYTLEKDTHSKY